jgi:hypothetical protein
MRKFIHGSLFIILSGFIFFLISCTPGSCFEDTKSSLKATFYTNISEISKPVAPDTLTLIGLNRDSVIYKKALKVQPALIQLNPSSSSSSFLITINGVTDTITFWYSSYPHFISKECGYTFYNHLDSIPIKNFKLIKDIYISNPTITNLNAENIRIFY